MYEIDYDQWRKPKPFGISGCFRLRNEAQFMEAAILSHLPYMDEAVLVVQPSEDNTVELALELERDDPRIKVHFYDFECDWIDTPEFYAKDPHKPGHLVHMSNWALSKCSYSWVNKVEGDVICLSTFANIIERVQDFPDRNIYYGRVILNVAGENCDQISVDNPRNGGWDEAVFMNNPDLWHFERRNKWEVVVGTGPTVCMGWSALHMKRCKVGKVGWNNETYAPFTRESVRQVLADFNARNTYPGPDDPLGEECLFEEVLWLPVTAS